MPQVRDALADRVVRDRLVDLGQQVFPADEQTLAGLASDAVKGTCWQQAVPRSPGTNSPTVGMSGSTSPGRIGRASSRLQES
jgi:hypothetical protein